MDAIRAKKGWSVIDGPVGVRNKDGQLRNYDGLAVSPRQRQIGIEVKSGSARKTAPQRNFDSGVSRSNPAYGVGKNKGVTIKKTKTIRRRR
jgi:hypothetical protein